MSNGPIRSSCSRFTIAARANCDAWSAPTFERLRVELPGDRWTAGEPVPLSIQFEPSGRPIHPTWRAWLRPYNTPEFTELPIEDGKIVPPADAGGLYQLRVCPGLFGSASEYQVETVVEIRRPQAQGSISLWTPLGRIYYGQGEEVPVTVLCRTGEKPPVSRLAKIVLVEEGRTIAEQTIEVVPGKAAKIALSKKFTAALRPGRYWLTAVAADLTPAGQMLIVGPGIARPPVFTIVQYGDGLCFFPIGAGLNTADAVMQHVARLLKIGANMVVDCLGHGVGMGALFTPEAGARDLRGGWPPIQRPWPPKKSNSKTPRGRQLPPTAPAGSKSGASC